MRSTITVARSSLGWSLPSWPEGCFSYAPAVRGLLLLVSLRER